MKITQISHRNIKTQSFKSGTANKQISNLPAKQPNNQNQGCMPNSVYWALVGYALATSTPAINFVEKITGIDEETKQMNLLLQKQQENFERCLDLTDEFTKVKGLSVAHHPLRQFAETDMAEFFDIDEKTKGMAFSTDDNIIGLEINPDENTMFGKLIIRNKKDTAQTAIYEYKAELTEKAAKEIKIELKKQGSEKQDTINLKRLNNGSLVVEQNGKSKIINRENVKKYQSMADNYFMLNEIERRKGHNDLLYMFLLGLTIAKVFKKND